MGKNGEYGIQLNPLWFDLVSGLKPLSLHLIMEKKEGIEQIKKTCHGIAGELLRLHPATAALGDKEVQDEIYRALFELTRQLETIKKLTRKVELKSLGDEDLPPVL